MTVGRRGSKKQIVVIKIGGSILNEPKAYRRAACFIRNWLRAASTVRLVTVVSGQNGTTDAQERLAQRIVAAPDPRTLDLLWATGELRSVALLTMHLHALGLQAVGLNVHETGLRASNSANGDAGFELRSNKLKEALSERPVAVVPGFLATKIDGSIISLGRGGSDLTAVLLARKLGALRCELVKDVPGYFTSDPNRAKTARHIPFLTYERALAMADAGCDLVQRRAIEVASEANVPLVVRSLTEGAPKSIVSG